MTTDTIFDLASLTKPVATATSVMLLVERGLVRLGDPVARYLPEFAAAGKQNITVEHLLVHRSGLIADNEVKVHIVFKKLLAILKFRMENDVFEHAIDFVQLSIKSLTVSSYSPIECNILFLKFDVLQLFLHNFHYLVPYRGANITQMHHSI